MSRKGQVMQFKAYVVYGISALFGVWLAWFVFDGMKAVEFHTKILTQQSIPSLMLARELAAGLNEQERILYEYYATTDERLYPQQFQPLHELLKQQLLDLAGLTGDTVQHNLLKQELGRIKNLSVELHSNLGGDAVDWDLARTQLTNLSEQRRQMLPQLETLIGVVNNDVETGYRQTLAEVSATSWSVVLFSTALLLASLLMGRYAANYIRLSISNERLAMFPKRNPNPVLSLSPDLDILDQNPATQLLLNDMQLSPDPLQLFSAHLNDELLETQKSAVPVRFFQHQIRDRFLRYEVHWIRDVGAFDIHVQDLTQQIQAEAKLIYQAYHHDLSGLENRLRFSDDVQALIEANVVFSVILVELAQYSRLLSHYGIDGMADIVKTTAQHLNNAVQNWQKSQLLRPQLYQIADASFAVVLTTNNDNAALHQLCTLLQRATGPSINTTVGELHVPLQLGITEFPRCSTQQVDLLLHAKIAIDQLPGGLSYFDHQTGSAHQRKLLLNDRLQHAIENNELELYFQPQMNISRRSLSGAETLLRWKMDGNFVSPAEFIPLAEQSGYILPLGDWILETAIKKTAAFQALLQQPIRIAVNISARQFMQPDFVLRVVQLLRDYQLRPDLLELEITESMVMENEQAGLAVLKALKSHGICLAIDDFGTGYSSLSYLKKFPIDKLKIDQSFIRSMPEHSKDQAIVLSLCQLAHKLGMRVIAEGVEEVEQLMLLTHFGCDAVQGYHFSRPLPEGAFLQFCAVNTLTAE